MKKQRLTNTKRHWDCRYCKPFTEGFLNNQGEPILGECEHLPYKVILNELTNCELWQNKNK